MSNMSNMFNVRNWYWIVGGSTTQVYSSASVSYVPMSDPTYNMWISEGNHPTVIDNEADLSGVFFWQYPQGWYKNTAVTSANAAITHGITIVSQSTPSLNGIYALDSNSIENITGTELYILTNGTFPEGTETFPWADKNGTVHIFPNVAMFKAFATAVGDFVSAVEQYANTGQGFIPNNTVTIP